MNTGLKRSIFALFTAISLFFVATPARASGEVELVVFYGALKLSQSQAMKATANYYQAIGMGAKAQQYTNLANGFAGGSLGGSEGIETFVQSSAAVERDIYELQALGAYPTARQKELAKKAREQLGVARVALFVAIAAGTKGVLQCDCNALRKILLAALAAAEAGKVISALDRVSKASKAYDNFQLGGANGFQVVSSEAKSQFIQL